MILRSSCYMNPVKTGSEENKAISAPLTVIKLNQVFKVVLPSINLSLCNATPSQNSLEMSTRRDGLTGSLIPSVKFHPWYSPSPNQSGGTTCCCCYFIKADHTWLLLFWGLFSCLDEAAARYFCQTVTVAIVPPTPPPQSHPLHTLCRSFLLLQSRVIGKQHLAGTIESIPNEFAPLASMVFNRCPAP